MSISPQLLKCQKRLNKMFEEDNMDYSFIEINVNKKITEKLLDYQIYHLYNLISSIKDNGVAIDGSGTGTGKTYTAIATCMHFGYTPIILCPKSMIQTWKNVCIIFGCENPIIVNYETLKYGHQYLDNDANNKRITSNIIQQDAQTQKYTWNVTKNNILIVDEAHKCKSKTSLNGKMLMAIRNKCKILLLSATIADSPTSFFVYGYVLQLFRTQTQCNAWVKNILNAKQVSMTNVNPLHEYLFPKYGSIMHLSETKSATKQNIIIPNNYTIGRKSEIKMNKLLDELDKTKLIEINKILILRQHIELIKTEIIKK